jgi:hypothetical protein
MTFTRPPAADCRGGKAVEACSTKRRTGSTTEGRDAFTKRPFSVLQNESSPQPDGVGDSESEGIVVGLEGSQDTGRHAKEWLSMGAVPSSNVCCERPDRGNSNMFVDGYAGDAPSSVSGAGSSARASFESDCTWAACIASDAIPTV